jgi:hypothetical protein
MKLMHKNFIMYVEIFFIKQIKRIGYNSMSKKYILTMEEEY